MDKALILENSRTHLRTENVLLFERSEESICADKKSRKTVLFSNIVDTKIEWLIRNFTNFLIIFMSLLNRYSMKNKCIEFSSLGHFSSLKNSYVTNSCIFSIVNLFILMSRKTRFKFFSDIHKITARCLRNTVSFMDRMILLYKNTRLNVEQVSSSSNIKLLLKLSVSNNLEFLPIPLIILGIIVLKTLENVIRYDPASKKNENITEKNSVCEVSFIEVSETKKCSENIFTRMPRNNEPNIISIENGYSENNIYEKNKECGVIHTKTFSTVEEFIKFCERCYLTDYSKLFKTMWNVIDKGKFFISKSIHVFGMYISVQIIYSSNSLNNPLSSSDNCIDVELYKLAVHDNEKYVFLNVSHHNTILVNFKTLQFYMNVSTMSQLSINTCANFTNQKAGCAYSSSSDASECSTPRISRNAKKAGQNSRGSEKYAKYPGSSSDLTLNVTTPLGRKKRYESGDLGSKSNLDEDSDDFYGETKSKLVNYQANTDISKNIPGRKPKQRKKTSKESSSRYDRGEYINTKDDENRFDLILHKGKTNRERRSKSPTTLKYIEKRKKRMEKIITSSEYTLDAYSTDSNSEDSYKKVPINKNKNKIAKSPMNSRRNDEEKVISRLENAKVLENVRRPSKSIKNEKYRAVGPDKRVFSTLYTNKNVCEASSLEAIPETHMNKLKYKADAPSPKKKLLSKYFQEYISTDESDFTEEYLDDDSHKTRDRFFNSSAVDISKKQNHRNRKQRVLESQILPEAGKKRKPERKSTREFVIDKRKRVSSTQDIEKSGFGDKSNAKKDVDYFKSKPANPPKYNVVRQKRKSVDIKSDQKQKTSDCTPAKRNKIASKNEQSLSSSSQYDHGQNVRNPVTQTSPKNQKLNSKLNQGNNVFLNNGSCNLPLISNPFNASKSFSKGGKNDNILPEDLQESMNSILQRLETKLGRVCPERKDDVRFGGNKWPFSKISHGQSTQNDKGNKNVTNDTFKKYTNQIAINSVVFQPASIFSDPITDKQGASSQQQCYRKYDDINYERSSALPNKVDDNNKCYEISPAEKRSNIDVQLSKLPIKVGRWITAPTHNNDSISDFGESINNQKNEITSEMQHCNTRIPETKYFVLKNKEPLAESINSENTSREMNDIKNDYLKGNYQQDSTILQLITDVIDTKNNSTSLKADSIEEDKINEFIKCAVDIFKILEKTKGNAKAEYTSDNIKEYLNDTLRNIGNNINKTEETEALARDMLTSNTASPFDKNILVYNQVTSKNFGNSRNQEIQTVFSNRTKNVQSRKSDKTDFKYKASSEVVFEQKRKENLKVRSHSPSNHTTSTCKTCRTAIVNSKPQSDGVAICHVCTKKIHLRNAEKGDIAKECAVQCSKNAQSSIFLHKCEHKPQTILGRKTQSVSLFSSMSTDISYLDIGCDPTNTDLSICPYYPDGECSSKCNACNMILKHNMKCTSFSSADISHVQHSHSRFNMDVTDDSEVNVLYHLGRNFNCKQCKFSGARNQYKDTRCLSHKLEDTVSQRSFKCNKLAMNIAVGCNLEKSPEKRSKNITSREDMTVLKMTCSTHKYPTSPIKNSLFSNQYVTRNKCKEIRDDKSEKKHDKSKRSTAVTNDKDQCRGLPFKSKIKELSSEHTVAEEGAMLKDDVYSKVKKVCRDTIQKGFQKYSKQYKSHFKNPKENQKVLAATPDTPVLEQSIVSSKFGTVVISKGSYPRDSDTYILTNNETSGDDIPPPVPRRPHSLLTPGPQGKCAVPPPLPTRKYCLMNPANKTENMTKRARASELSETLRDFEKLNKDKSNTTFIRDLTTSDTKEMSCDEETYVPRETVFYYTSKKGSQCFMGDVLHRSPMERPRKDLKRNETNDFHASTNSSVSKKKVNNTYSEKNQKDLIDDSVLNSFKEKVPHDTQTSKVRVDNDAKRQEFSNLNKIRIDKNVEAPRLPSKYLRKSRSDFKIGCMKKCDKHLEYDASKRSSHEKYLDSEKFQPTVLSTSKHSKKVNKSIKISNDATQTKKSPLKSYKSHSCSMLPRQRKDCKNRIVQTDLYGKDKELQLKAIDSVDEDGNDATTSKVKDISREKIHVEKDQQLARTDCSRNVKRFLGSHNVLSTVTNAMCIRSVNEVYFQVPRSNADDRPFSESISLEETEDGSENILLFGDIAVIPKMDKNIEIYFKNTTHLDGVDTFDTNTDNQKNISEIYSNSVDTESCTNNFTSYGKQHCHNTSIRKLECSKLESNEIPEQFISLSILEEPTKFSSLDNTSKPSEIDSDKPAEPKNLKMFDKLDESPREYGTLHEYSSVQKIAQVASDPNNITPLDSFEDDLYIQSILQECLQKEKCKNSCNGCYSSDNCFNDNISYRRQKLPNNDSDTVSDSKIETCVNVYDYEESKIDSVLLEAKKLAAYRENLNKQTNYLPSGKYIQNQKEFANMIEEISGCLLPPKIDDYFLLTDPIITEPLDMLGKYKLKEDSLPDKSSKKDLKESDNSSILSQKQNLSISGGCRSNKDSCYWGDLIEVESEILGPIANLNVSDNSDLDVIYKDSQSCDGLNLAVSFFNKRQVPTRKQTINVDYFIEDTTKNNNYKREENVKKNYDALWEQFKDVLQVFRYVEKQSKEGQVNTATSNETLGDMNIVTESNQSIQKLMLDLISSNQFTRMGENMLMEMTKKYDADIPKLHQEINSGTLNEEVVDESNIMSEQQLKLTLDKLETMKERLMKLKGNILVRENEYYDESESSDNTALGDSRGNFFNFPIINYNYTSNSKAVTSATCKDNKNNEDLRNSCWTRENATQHFINTKLYKTMKQNSSQNLDVSLSESFKNLLRKIENESTTGSESDELRLTDDSCSNVISKNKFPCYSVNYHKVAYECKERGKTNTYELKRKSNKHIEQKSISSFKSDDIVRVYRKDRKKLASNLESSHVFNGHSNRDRRFKKQEVSSRTSKSEPSISASRGTFKAWPSKSDRRCSDRSFASSSARYDMCLKDNCLDVGKYAEISGKIASKKCNSSDFASEISTTLDSCKISVGLHMEDDANKGLFW